MDLQDMLRDKSDRERQRLCDIVYMQNLTGQAEKKQSELCDYCEPRGVEDRGCLMG